MQIYLAKVEPEFCWTNSIYLLHKYYFNIDYDQSSTNKHCFSSEMNTNMLFATYHNHITCCFFLIVIPFRCPMVRIWWNYNHRIYPPASITGTEEKKRKKGKSGILQLLKVWLCNLLFKILFFFFACHTPGLLSMNHLTVCNSVLLTQESNLAAIQLHYHTDNHESIQPPDHWCLCPWISKT